MEMVLCREKKKQQRCLLRFLLFHDDCTNTRKHKEIVGFIYNDTYIDDMYIVVIICVLQLKDVCLLKQSSNHENRDCKNL